MMMTLEPKDRDTHEPTDPVSGLLEEYLAMSSRGEAPSPEAFADMHPEHRNELLDAVDALTAVEELLSELPEQGERLGRFLITGVIGNGSMATVYRAHDPTLDREVALKVFHPGLRGNGSRVSRTLAEARALARVDHPHVVKIFDVGEQDGHHYLCLELCEGVGLHQKLRSSGPLPPSLVVSLGRQLASALAAVHSKGLLHRDIKPSNITMDAAGQCKLLDFSVAASSQQAMLTPKSIRVGTPTYMAPEQFAGEEVNERSDIYSLGLVMYECLVGRHPYRRETPEEVCDAVRQGIVPPLPKHVPRELAAIVMKVLARNREERFASATELEVALAAEERRLRMQARRRILSLAGVGLVVLVAGAVALAPRPKPVLGDVTWLVQRAGANEALPLRPDDTVAEGDWVFVEIDLKQEAWVYVVFENEEGRFVRMFPSSRARLKNPLRAQRVMLPAPVPASGQEAELNRLQYWEVDSRPGNETLQVYATIDPNDRQVFESLSELPLAEPDHAEQMVANVVRGIWTPAGGSADDGEQMQAKAQESAWDRASFRGRADDKPWDRRDEKTYSLETLRLRHVTR
ncbi:MAG: protein kinase [Planctomycetota bacterium]